MVLRLPLLAQLARSAPVRGAVFRQRRVFSTAAEDPAAEDPVQALIDKEISTHQVMIFSKSYCPFCDKVKAIFDERKNPYHAMELDERPDGGAIQKTLEKFTGQRTVPNVFVNGTHVGGASDVENYHESGLLDHLMEDTSTHKAE